MTLIWCGSSSPKLSLTCRGGFGWVGLNRVSLNWIKFNWVQFACIVLRQVKFNKNKLCQAGLKSIGLSWIAWVRLGHLVAWVWLDWVNLSWTVWVLFDIGCLCWLGLCRIRIGSAASDDPSSSSKSAHKSSHSYACNSSSSAQILRQDISNEFLINWI